MATWLYNPGEPHAAESRGCGNCPNVPKYFRLTSGAFSVSIHPLLPSVQVHFPAQDAILKRVTNETPGRITGIEGYCEWWQVVSGREKFLDVDDPDLYPRARWFVFPRPGLPEWRVIGNFWAEPDISIPWQVAGGGVENPDFPWVGIEWSCFGRNELLFFGDPADGPRVWVEAYWP